MVKFRNRRKKSVLYIAITAMSTLFLLVLSLNYSRSVMASAPAAVTPTAQAITGASLVVSVSPASAAVNSTVVVNMGLANVQNIYGMQVTCKVDPKVLQGTSHSDGDVFNSSNSFFVDKGFQADGSWVAGASRLQPNPAFAGNGIAFKLNYTVKAVTGSTINCTVLAVNSGGQQITLSVVNGSFNGAPVATAQPTIQPTIQPTATVTMTPTTVKVTPTLSTSTTIKGKAIFQNYPSNANITVQLITTTTVIATVKTGADGSFTFTNVPNGSLGVTAVGNLYLRVGKAVTVTAKGQSFDLGTMTLPGGDTDNSGDIVLKDASLVGANFNAKVNPAPAAADINGDDVIDIRDLAILGGNFGLKAPIVLK